MLTEDGCRKRRERLWERLPPDVNAVLVADPRHVGYLSNFWVNPLSFSFGERGLLICERSGRTVLLADNFTRKSVSAEPYVGEEILTDWYDHRHSVENRDHALFEALGKVSAIEGGTLLFEAEWTPAMCGEVVRDFVKADAALHYGDEQTLGSLLRDLRREKLPDEIDALKACMAAGDAGHAAAFEAVKAGATDLDVYCAVQAAAEQAAGRPGLVYGDFRASTPQKPKAGGLPANKTLSDGELFILDYSIVLDAYRSDFTNTLAVGTPTDDQQKLFDACVAAMKSAEGVLKAGAEAKAVYDAASSVLEDAGYGKLAHHAGHGLGMGHPEPPILVPESVDVLRENDVVTLEPGAYIEGVGGVRVENNYRITADGFECLSGHRIALTK